MGCGKSCGRLGLEEKGENAEINDGMCEKCCYAGRGNINYVDILQGVAQGCTVSPNLFKVHTNGLIVAARQESRWGKIRGVGIDVCG